MSRQSTDQIFLSAQFKGASIKSIRFWNWRRKTVATELVILQSKNGQIKSTQFSWQFLTKCHKFMNIFLIKILIHLHTTPRAKWQDICVSNPIEESTQNKNSLNVKSFVAHFLRFGECRLNFRANEDFSFAFAL